MRTQRGTEDSPHHTVSGSHLVIYKRDRLIHIQEVRERVKVDDAPANKLCGDRVSERIVGVVVPMDGVQGIQVTTVFNKQLRNELGR